MTRMLLRYMLLFCLASCVTVLAGCPKSASKGTALDETQYAYSAAIRWGDFEGAWNLVDPEYRDKHPLTDIDFSRYKQVQISGYREKGMALQPSGTVMREIEIGVINRNTMAERNVRYRENWRYDEASKRWWLDGGLPDLWQGE